MKTIPPHPLALTSLSADSTGSRALISSIEGTVMLWDLSEGRVTASKETFAQAKEGIDAGDLVLCERADCTSERLMSPSLVCLHEPSR